MDASKKLENVYKLEAFDKDGNKYWEDKIVNLVTDEGLTDSLDKHLKGSNYSASWFVGLTGSAPTFAAGDTLASHAGWSEVTAYDEAARPALVLGTAAAKQIDNSASKAEFTINADGTTIGGAFIASGSAKSGTTGILYGGGALNGGDTTLSSGSTLRITITCSAAAA